MGNAMKIIASGSEEKDELFLHVQIMVLNNKVNSNGIVATKDFIKSIVENQEKYSHTPLFCDIEALKKNKTLTHRFNRLTRKFETNQIGSFVSFRSVEIEDVVCLLGEVKIPKRDKELVDALLKLANNERLLFSYEAETLDTIKVGNVEYITGDERNHLIGVAVVTDPAIKEAKALKVAEEEKAIEKEDLEDLEKEKKVCEELEDETEKKPETEDVIEPKVDEEDLDKDEKVAESQEEKEEIIQLKKDLETANAKIDRLQAERDDFEAKYNSLNEEKMKHEHDTKKEELMQKVSAVLSEEEMISLAEAFEELDENKINKALAEKLIKEQVSKKEKEQEKKIETSSTRITDAVINSGRSKWITE